MNYSFDIDSKEVFYRSSLEDLERLQAIDYKIPLTKGKKRKALQREYDNLIGKTKFTVEDYKKYQQKIATKQKIVDIKEEIQSIDSWITRTCNNQIEMLKNMKFITEDNKLTNKGNYAICLQETFSLPVAELVDEGWLDNIDTPNLVGILSCFTNMRLADEQSVLSIDSIDCDDLTKKRIHRLVNCYHKYIDIFNREKIDIIENIELQFNLCELVIKWCYCEDEMVCKKIIAECRHYDINLGDFVKAILKINNISKELENIATIAGNLSLLGKLREVPNITLKFCVTNQSLYL